VSFAIFTSGRILLGGTMMRIASYHDIKRVCCFAYNECIKIILLLTNRFC
jgi:hypothetical protein